MLQSVASGTTVNLIWEANIETDFAGYMVLRGEAPGDKLAPLTKTPITDASYADSTVQRERTYVYEVIAVDKAGNQSAPSNRVEDTIR
jgi:fibronectin type 3 domain-containing protein